MALGGRSADVSGRTESGAESGAEGGAEGGAEEGVAAGSGGGAAVPGGDGRKSASARLRALRTDA
ncbi:hypothetical protein GCM10022284_74140 [Streptomyces hundungensis]